MVRTAARFGARTAAQRRARVLTVLLSLTCVAWVMSILVPAAVTAALVVTTLLGLDLIALVASARHRAVRRATIERARRHEAERRRAEARRRPLPAAPDDQSVPLVVTPPCPAETVTEIVDVEICDADAEAPAERVARELAEGGVPWVPVPVPPPTYTLKPMAPRPEPAPLDLSSASRLSDPEPVVEREDEPAAEVTWHPRPWETDRTFADDLDLDAVLARRRAANG